MVGEGVCWRVLWVERSGMVGEGCVVGGEEWYGGRGGVLESIVGGEEWYGGRGGVLESIVGGEEWYGGRGMCCGWRGVVWWERNVLESIVIKLGG